MHKILTFLLFFFAATNSFAQNLCDASCDLTITFPDGGSIVAIEPVTITFGTNGVLDLGATGTINAAIQPASTDFSAGGTLSLAAGESITFDNNGLLDLGVAGNIDYTSMVIVTATGDITIDGATGSVVISDISITANTLTINTDAIVEGVLGLSGDITIDGTSALTIEGTISFNSGTTTVDINVDSSNGSIISVSGSVDVTSTGSLILEGGQIVIDSSLSTIELNSSNTTVNIGGTLTILTEITINGVLYTSDDGIKFKSPDGVTGKIEFSEGEFVFVPDTPALNADSGSLDLWLMTGLIALLLMFRAYGRKAFSIL